MEKKVRQWKHFCGYCREEPENSDLLKGSKRCRLLPKVREACIEVRARFEAVSDPDLIEIQNDE